MQFSDIKTKGVDGQSGDVEGVLAYKFIHDGVIILWANKRIIQRLPFYDLGAERYGQVVLYNLEGLCE